MQRLRVHWRSKELLSKLTIFQKVYLMTCLNIPPVKLIGGSLHAVMQGWKEVGCED